jgi:hypothetical protein
MSSAETTGPDASTETRSRAYSTKRCLSPSASAFVTPGAERMA